MTQATIFDDVKPSAIDQAFWDFHKANPHIYRNLVEMALQARAAGNKKIGIGMLFEKLRWDYTVATQHKEFKLNNSHRSRYARIIEENNPELAGIFEKRKLSS